MKCAVLSCLKKATNGDMCKACELNCIGAHLVDDSTIAFTLMPQLGDRVLMAFPDGSKVYYEKVKVK